MTTRHPQNRVPTQVFTDLATLIRPLDGDDVHLVSTAVDLDEDPPVDFGEDLFEALVDLTDRYDVSAAFLVSEACICLGWPVTA